jgi:hypothetical protein
MSTDNMEGVTIDKEGHKIVIHDADEARLAAMGKKRNSTISNKAY